MANPAREGAVARGLRDFWDKTGCYLVTNPREGISVGSIYSRDPGRGIAIRIDDLENLVKSKTEEASFELPPITTSEDSDQINDSSDFSNTQIRATFLGSLQSKIANTLHIEGKWQSQNQEQLVTYFLNNFVDKISFGKLESKVQDYVFDKTIFDCDAMKEHFIVIQVRRTKKFAVCYSNSKDKDFSVLMHMGDLLDAEASHLFDSDEFSCAICPSQNQNGLVYAVKVTRIIGDATSGAIKIEEPSNVSIQFHPIGVLPMPDVSKGLPFLDLQ